MNGWVDLTIEVRGRLVDAKIMHISQFRRSLVPKGWRLAGFVDQELSGRWFYIVPINSLDLYPIPSAN